MLATKLGRTIIPVIENFDELELILKHAERYRCGRALGVRVKLFSEGSGRWRDSAGEKSKFGLFITEILELFAVLKARDMLDCLQLVHCHPGSQLQDIRRVKDAINELAHVYAELKLMGAGLQYIDVGGGLGVDYDGSGTNLLLVDELHAQRVRERRGLSDRQRLQRARHPAPDDHQRVRPRDRGLPQRADLQCARLVGARQVPGHRRGGRGLRRRRGAAAAGAGPVRCLPHRERAAAGRVLSRRPHGARAGAADVQSRAAVAGVPRPGRAALLGQLRAHPRRLPHASSACPRSSRTWRRSSRTPISATSRCSSRCPTAGPSTSCSRSCRSTGSTSGPRARACWRTSPATRTARSTTSSLCATSSARSSCTS